MKKKKIGGRKEKEETYSLKKKIVGLFEKEIVSC